ncbi:MAG: hypothetical protein MJ192_00820 [Clostridia bacterium]|nr:hypothetical protein [Clostridia bacterium]
MTKRILALLLLSAMMLTCLVACKNNGDDTGTTVAETGTDAEPTQAATDAPTEPATDAPTEPATDAPTEPATAAPTEPATEAPTEPAETEPADGIYDLDAEKACFAAKSFDECEAWDAEGNKLVTFFTPGQAASCPEIVDIPSDSASVRFWGWIGTTQDITALGYRIDKNAPVFSEEWFFNPEDGVVAAVTGAGGTFATRFNIYADVSSIPSGNHTLTALYKLADGTMVAITSVKVNIDYRKPVLGDATKSLTSDVASQSDFASSDLFNLFTPELPINQCGIEDGKYKLAGICDFVTTMDGKYSVALKDFWCQNAEGAYFFVRGTEGVTSDDVAGPDTHINDLVFYPINNYYETDGHPEGNSCGGAGICISRNDGGLTVTIKAYDAEWPSRVTNYRFNYACETGDILITDDNNVVNIYAGKTLLVSIALDGSVAIDEYAGLHTNQDVHFVKTATLTGADGSVNTVENTLVVDNAASDIGATARATTVLFSSIEVKALSETVIPGDPVYIVYPEFIMDQVNGGTGSTVSHTTAEMGDGFITLTSNGGDPYVAVVNLNANAKSAKYGALKYRTTGTNGGEFFIGSTGGWHGGDDEARYEYQNDGEWHVLVVDMTASASFNDTSVCNYCRLDYFLGNGGSIDVAWFAFFETAEEAEAYFAKSMPAEPVAPEIDWNNVKLQETLAINADQLGVAGFTRGAAFSPDGKYFFAGVLNANPNNVSMIDVATGERVAYLTFEANAFAKGLAVDDRGYLYVGLANYDSQNDVYLEVYKIDYDAKTLTQVSRLCVCAEDGKSMRVNGLGVANVGGEYIAYLFSDKQNVMFKLNVTDAANPAVVDSKAMAESFYLDVDTAGACYAATTGGKLSVLASDGSIAEYDVPNAYAVGMYDKYALVAPKAQAGNIVLYVVDKTTGETVANVTSDADLSAGSQFVYVKVCGDTLFVVVQNDRILSAKLY